MADVGSRRSTRRHDQRGGVLVLVVLLVLALELLAHGVLLMARQEAAASHAGAAILQVHAAAQAGLSAADAPAGVAYDTVPMLGTLSGPSGTLGARGRWAVTARRLTRESWLWESTGSSQGPGGTERLGALMWLPDPVVRLGRFGGVVVVGAGADVSGAEAIQTAGVRRDASPLDPEPCRAWRDVLDSLYRAPVPAVAVEEMDVALEPSLGRLHRGDLLSWIGAATGSARAVAGDVRIEDGRGGGLLVVTGDLVLVGGRHEGVALVGGRLRLEDGAVFVGFARAAGGISLTQGSSLIGSGCRALAALSADLGRWARPVPLYRGPFPLY